MSDREPRGGVAGGGGPRRKITSLVGAALLIALAVGWGLWGAIADRRELVDSTRASLEGTAESSAQHLAAWLAERRADAQMVSGLVQELLGELETSSSAASLRIHARLRDVHIAYHYTAMRLVHRERGPLASFGEPAPAATPEPAFDRPAVRRSSAGADVLVTLRFPLGPANDRDRFYLDSTASYMAMISPVLRFAPRERASLRLYWIAEDGSVAIHLPTGGTSAPRLDEAGRLVPPALTAAIRDARPLAGTFADPSGLPVIAAVAPVEGVDWAIVAMIDEVDALDPWTKMVEFRGLALLALGLAVAALLWGLREADRREAFEALSGEQARFRSLLDEANDAILFIRARDARLLEVNHRAEEMYGYTAAELRQMTVQDLRLADDPVPLKERIQEAIRKGTVFQTRHRRKDGSILPVEVSVRRVALDEEPVLCALVRDLTDRVADQARIERLNEVLRILVRFSDQVSSARERDHLLQATCELLVGETAFQTAMIGMVEPDGTEYTVRAIAGEGAPTVMGRRFEIDADSPFGNRPTALAIRERRQVTIDEWGADADAPPLQPGLSALGIRSSTAVPIVEHGRVSGVLSVYSTSPHDVPPEVGTLLAELGARLGIALAALDSERARQAATAALSESEARYRLLFERHPQPLWIYDRETFRLLAVNDTACSSYGWTRAEMLTMTLFDVHVERERERLAEVVLSRAGPLRRVGVWRQRRKDGSELDVEVVTYDLEFAGHPARLVLLDDITARRAAEAKLRLLGAALEASADGVLITDAEGKIEWVNPAFSLISGWESGEVLGQTPRLFRSGIHGRTFYDQLWDTLRQGRVWRGEIYNRRKDGSIVPVEATISPVPDERGGIGHYVATQHDLSLRRRQEEELRIAATTDALTGLPNRAALRERLELAVAEASEGRTSALLLVDVDQFRVVNDALGHGVGDQLLLGLTARLGALAPAGSFLSRTGGNELAVLWRAESAEQAAQTGERIRQELSASRHPTSAGPVDLSLSGGIAWIDGRAPAWEVQARADAALAGAKEGGRSRLGADQDGSARVRLGSDLFERAARVRDAVREHRLVLHFQPLIQLAGGSIDYHEALVRLVDENGELESPASFLPATERFGLSSLLDRAVVEACLAELERRPGLRLFINLSGRTLADEELLDWLRERFAQPELAARVVFEITETAAVGELAEAQRWIHRLRETGVRFALDDFGTGFSSFSYLRALPVDFVKIDGSFVRAINEDATAFALVKAMTEVARAYGRSVVAESVEDEPTARRLVECGVDYAQGFFWGRPAPLD